MASVEFEGKDLEEAIAKAAAALNLPPEQIKFSVATMGTKGFLGLGRRKARIAVNPDDPALTIEDDQPDGRPRIADPAPAVSAPNEETGERGNRYQKISSATTPKSAKVQLSQEDGSKQDSKKTEDSVSPKKTSRDHRLDKKDRIKERPAPPVEAQPLDWSHLPPVLTKPGGNETLIEGTVDQAGELALTVTREVLTRMGFEAEIAVSRVGDRIVLALESADNALLIGARGATLEALQLLVNKIVGRRLAEAEAAAPADSRVVLDVADYRARRRDLLLENLKSLSLQVRRTRKPQTMPGLNSDERRLIQLALRPFKDLHVISSGGREALTISPHPPRPRRKGPGGGSS